MQLQVPIAFSVPLAAAMLTVSAMPLSAEPNIQTPEPVIHLADNLDEKDNLGWCIDTIGRGFSDKLHAHSCKPRGGDVQFYYDTASMQIRSAEYEGKCATVVKSMDSNIPLGLLDCIQGAENQKFRYLEDTMEFRPAGICNNQA